MTNIGGPRPTLIDAFEAAVRDVRARLARHGVRTDIEADIEAGLPGVVQAPPDAATAEELEWLARWVDDQDNPAEITVEQADAMLAQHRQRQQAGASNSTMLRFSSGCMLRCV